MQPQFLVPDLEWPGKLCYIALLIIARQKSPTASRSLITVYHLIYVENVDVDTYVCYILDL